jgi:hypothetical protein
MSRHSSESKHARFIKVVYTKIFVNGKVELVPLELYADGSLKPQPA